MEKINDIKTLKNKQNSLKKIRQKINQLQLDEKKIIKDIEIIEEKIKNNKSTLVTVTDKNGNLIAMTCDSKKNILKDNCFENLSIEKSKIKYDDNTKDVFNEVTLNDLTEITGIDEYFINYYDKDILINSYKFNLNSQELISIL